MIEIIKNLEDHGIIPQVCGERYERNTRQTLTKKDFEQLLKQLNCHSNIYIEEEPLLSNFPITPNLLKIVELKQSKSIFKMPLKYVYLNEN